MNDPLLSLLYGRFGRTATRHIKFKVRPFNFDLIRAFETI